MPRDVSRTVHVSATPGTPAARADRPAWTGRRGRPAIGGALRPYRPPTRGASVTDPTARPPIRLVVLDMAGTTVADDGLVLEAFTAAMAGHGVFPGEAAHERMLAYVRATMGESKIAVFRELLDGDERRARAANAAFEEAYDALVAAGRCAAVPGAEETIRRLRADGVMVALTTGFSARTQSAILRALGWQGLADVSLCPADAGRGRPYPDLVFAALMRLGLDDVRAVAVAGDTAADMLTARRAGAAVAAGVLTGAHDTRTLTAAGATHILNSITDLPAILTTADAPVPG
ncbi:MAG: phosphonatase-like hydrolase [Streptosporangiales bacterium]|nr:phosphonatase-like hydrolase [Streptosporangiales bacterium]